MPSSVSYLAHRLLHAHDFQDRPELSKVCQWWRSGGSGLRALIGFGGAGKTAIAERFLNLLPGVLPDSTTVQKDETLRKPTALFAFSFYEAPNPDGFFAHLL